MSEEYGWDRTSHLSVSKQVLTGAATCDRTLSCRRIILSCLEQYSSGRVFPYSAQSHQLCSVESPSNDLIRFEQLIIHDTKLIPPNTQNEFFFHEYSAWLSILKHSQMIPMISFFFRLSQWIHFSSPETIQCKKPFRLCLASSISHVKNWRSTFLGFSSYGTQFPCF